MCSGSNRGSSSRCATGNGLTTAASATPPTSASATTAKEPPTCVAAEAAPQPRSSATAERELRLSNLDKLFWPELGISKGDLIGYYDELAPLLVPHLAGRPFTMRRYPDGAGGKAFFQKNAPAHMPDWIPTFHAHVSARDSSRTKKWVDFPVVNDRLALLWMANMGCIDMNAWYSRVDQPDRPDFVLFDLDPTPGVPWSQTVEVALILKSMLDQLGLRSFPKTSGGKGFHVLVPLDRESTYEDTRSFAEAAAAAIARAHPKLATTEWSKARRKGVLIDANQNGQGKTIASVYSKSATAERDGVHPARMGRGERAPRPGCVHDGDRPRAGAEDGGRSRRAFSPRRSRSRRHSHGSRAPTAKTWHEITHDEPTWLPSSDPTRPCRERSPLFDRWAARGPSAMLRTSTRASSIATSPGTRSLRRSTAGGPRTDGSIEEAVLRLPSSAFRDARRGSNAAIAGALERFAALRELADAEYYSVRAYRKAAETVRTLPVSVAELVQRGGVRELRGIGPRIEASLRELIETGELAELQELEENVSLKSWPHSARLIGIGAKRAVEIGRALEIFARAQSSRRRHVRRPAAEVPVRDRGRRPRPRLPLRSETCRRDSPRGRC